MRVTPAISRLGRYLKLDRAGSEKAFRLYVCLPRFSLPFWC